MQCVITPAEPYLPKTNEEIAEILDQQASTGRVLAAVRTGRISTAWLGRWSVTGRARNDAAEPPCRVRPSLYIDRGVTYVSLALWRCGRLPRSGSLGTGRPISWGPE